ncbi:MAG: MaoC family dehydratase [Deltaproteobacteria bacterium]|nr:MaoC family dehydratase [Deltaproteobacteria bacterium]
MRWKVELTLGQVAIFKRTFTQGDYDRCAALTGDDNPIHVDPAFAATTRWGKTLAHGMLLYGVISGLIGTHLPGPGAVQLEQQLKFPGPTFTDEEMTIRLEVTALDPEARIAEIAALVTRPDGSASCEGTTRVRLPSLAGS